MDRTTQQLSIKKKKNVYLRISKCLTKVGNSLRALLAGRDAGMQRQRAVI